MLYYSFYEYKEQRKSIFHNFFTLVIFFSSKSNHHQRSQIKWWAVNYYSFSLPTYFKIQLSFAQW